eukprot:COSAG05_NODE_4900_length_1332_cov_3.766423_2_plen_51_part_01
MQPQLWELRQQSLCAWQIAGGQCSETLLHSTVHNLLLVLVPVLLRVRFHII